MILAFAAKGKKTIAYTMLALMYFEMVVPGFALGAIPHGTRPIVAIAPVKVVAETTPKTAPEGKGKGGPTQPESAEFHSVSSDKMVDLFSGDFSYSIPLMDVGGYPVAIGYNSGITMDQEASWTGLGWNVNVGAITRNMRGLPDDFNGMDSVKKTASVKENKTIGVSSGADVEIVGLPVGVSASIGVLHNTYKGWGATNSVGVSIDAGKSGAGELTAGLSLNNTSQDGLTVSPSISASLKEVAIKDLGPFSGNLSTSVSYNTRSGLKALQVSGGFQQLAKTKNVSFRLNGHFSGDLSFAYPTYTPSMSLPYTSNMVTVTIKAGYETKVVHPSFFLSGYISKQWIADADKVMYLPAYGYLNYQNGNSNPEALLDYNREKETMYREKPAIPNIAVPSYTYDVFSMTGEGTGGTFRAYRSDIGFVHDHYMKTRDASDNFSADLGFGDMWHVGVDFNYTRSYTQTGAWVEENPLASTVAFTQPDKNYEASYLRNPGEKTVNTKTFYDAIGGDYVVIPKLFQPGGDNTPTIGTTNIFTKYKDGKKLDNITISKRTAVKTDRDKRTQSISYLTAQEATTVGFTKYIENYTENKYFLQNCNNAFPEDVSTDSTGLLAEWFTGEDFKNPLFSRRDALINFKNKAALTADHPSVITMPDEHFSVRWTGRLKAPATGIYRIHTLCDDGIRLFVNDVPYINDMTNHPVKTIDTTINLEAGEIYNVKAEYFNGVNLAQIQLELTTANGDTVKAADFFMPVVRDMYTAIPGVLSKENRINSFRKANHISEIDVLNSDGKRYIYGLPVYNLIQKETTFSVKHERGNAEEGTVDYDAGTDNTTANPNGTDHYFNSEEVPAYAHSFLLTGIVSPDYTDLTNDGISDDDLGTAVKFNYTKIAGLANRYKWRTPYSAGANYNEGLKTDTRDDKGSYVYGEKELWYLNSIESKNMMATFKLGNRYDLVAIDENGNKDTLHHIAKRLEEINLYTKADFLKRDTLATPVKTVHFEYTYELCKGINAPLNDTGKLTLKRIWFTYNGNKKGRKNAYVFNYNAKNPGYDHKSFDRWGNYKNAADNPGYTSDNHITNAEYPYSIQDSIKAAASAPAWTLDSIVLPSGGRMKVTYEADDYAYVQNRRVANMYKVAGFSSLEPKDMGYLSNKMYSGNHDYLYVAVNVPVAVTSKQEVYDKYIAGMDEAIHFRLHVKMPSDKFGSGYEFVPSYAKLDSDNYGFITGNTIWFKVVNINKKAEDGGDYTPMAKSAIEFLRLNLPSKAYPGSDVGDNLDWADGVKVLTSMSGNIKNILNSYDAIARAQNWACEVDTSRSFVRLNNPYYKKYGGGLRVKKIVIYDNWNAMTGQKESMYGTEYQYKTIKNINGINKEISSGVASYEPVMGAEENPLRVPIQFTEQVAALAPVNMGYVETPMVESLFPGASVGYSEVSSRSINNKNLRSATGYEKTLYYTAFDFPTISEFSLLDNDSKKHFKPTLANFFHISAKHHLVMSQGFKVELNDMHGQMKAHYSYAEADKEPTSSVYNYYHVDNQNAETKHLNNTVLSMNAKGIIDSSAVIGKDIELMMDMREQKSATNGNSFSANVDAFTFAIPPVIAIPMLFANPQSDENIFRSVAATKVISRHGIMDSMVVIDKGSKVVTHNLLYDGETGDVVLTATQNEFGDSVYSFSYPAGWVYEGMSGAYKNINAVMNGVTIRNGKISSGATAAAIAACFTSGDEILINARNPVTDSLCAPALASFSKPGKIWAVDANALNGGTPDIYFMDQDGNPYTGNDVSMKVVRSGRRNISAGVGTVTMLKNPLVVKNGVYQLQINKDSKILSANMVEYKQNWQVQDRKKQKVICAY
jgi:hypothetical protein